MTGHDEHKENWTVTDSEGNTYTRKEICVLLDRTFRCHDSTSGSPLEYYGPIPRLVSVEEARRYTEKRRRQRERGEIKSKPWE